MAGPFVSNENMTSVMAAIKAKLDAKAASSHTHVCTDITDLETKLALYALKSDISAVYRYKGSTTWAELIAKEDAEVGDTYNVTDKNGMNYACITAGTAEEGAWDALGSITTVSLDGYYTITQVDAAFLKKTDAESTYATKAELSSLESTVSGKANASHTHTAEDITDFASSVESAVESALEESDIRALTEEELQAIVATLG